MFGLKAQVNLAQWQSEASPWEKCKQENFALKGQFKYLQIKLGLQPVFILHKRTQSVPLGLITLGFQPGIYKIIK
jgi:hypothetical protein